MSSEPLKHESDFSSILKKLDKFVIKKEEWQEVMDKQKQKFLFAITANYLYENNSDEDNSYLLRFIRGSLFSLAMNNNAWKLQASQWNLLELISLDEALDKCAVNFNMNMYLDCVRILFLQYFGFYIEEDLLYKVMLYIIMHARLFGNTQHTMFILKPKCSGEANIAVQDTENKWNYLPKTKYMLKINRLINDLTIKYDEHKYVILNVNVTYLCFYILRLYVKTENSFINSLKNIALHDNYVKLCPYPLSDQLPKPCQQFLSAVKLSFARTSRFDVKNNYILYITLHEYFKTNDELTKKIMRLTFITQLEWNGLQLPHFFFKVLKCYDIEASRLWDILLTENIGDSSIKKSLIMLSEEYYKHSLYKNKHFPFSRVLYHLNFVSLSAKYNEPLCYILAYLIDLKLGTDKSFLRNSGGFNGKKKVCIYKRYENIAMYIKNVLESE